MHRAWLLALGATIAAWSACDNDVELLSDDPGLAVVYGLINGSTDEQLISISRTFRFSDGGNALQSAQNADSVYFSGEDLSVTARNVSNGRTTPLRRVNLSDEGVVRAPGRFPTDANIAYRFSLDALAAEPGDSILLEGTLPGGRTFAAGAALLTPLSFGSNNRPPDAYSLTSRNDFSFRWRREAVGAEIKVFELGFNFAFTETGPGGTRQRVVYYAPGQNLSTSTNTASVPLNGIYAFLGTRLQRDPSITRRFDYIQLVLTGGDQGYLDYQSLVRANSGITATQELPAFSNVEGGLGLVGTITQLIQDPNGTLLPSSSDSLRLGSATRELNFQ